VPTQVAGVDSGTYYLRAVKKNTSTQACEAGLAGETAVNFAYECIDPAVCYAANMMSINGSADIARNNSGSVASDSAVSLNFEANGSAPIVLNYRDVGLVKLWVNKIVNSVTLTGSSNAFVVQPYAFSLSNIKCTTANAANCAPGALSMPTAGDNPAAFNEGGSSFIQAGNAFSATVAAVRFDSAQPYNLGGATPNFGKENSPEGVILGHALVQPSGGTNPDLSNAIIVGGSFNDGVATVNNLAWNEVGIINLTPSIADADYLGSGDVIGQNSGNVGRFIPSHFALTQGTAIPACGAFTYFGQDGFSSTGFKLTAQNVNNGTTQNYTGTFAKLPLTWDSFGFTVANPLAGAILSSSTAAPTGSWGSGEATITAKHRLSRPTVLASETNVVVQAKPLDSDGVTMTASDVTLGTPLRYGRLSLQNASGSELLDLPVPLTAEYWNGNSWVTNTEDSCTALIAPADGSGLGFQLANNGATTATLSNPLVFGDAGLSLSAPGVTHSGYVIVTIASPAWLDFKWDGVTDSDPISRATFGIYKGNSKFIYIRELY
jgi:MSHA biogenesis protein MshQ